MNYLKNEIKNFSRCAIAMTVIFLLSVVFGYWIAITNLEETKNIIRQLFTEYSFVKSLNVFLIFLYIFLNNAIKGFFVMIFGVFFGIAPIIFIFTNGELIGLVLGSSQGGVGPGKVLLGILPHGIFEIPAIILSASYGLWLGYRFYRFIAFSEPFKIYFTLALKSFVSIIVPLLLFAAFIETFITPFVLSRVLR